MRTLADVSTRSGLSSVLEAPAQHYVAGVVFQSIEIGPKNIYTAQASTMVSASACGLVNITSWLPGISNNRQFFRRFG